MCCLNSLFNIFISNKIEFHCDFTLYMHNCFTDMYLHSTESSRNNFEYEVIWVWCTPWLILLFYLRNNLRKFVYTSTTYFLTLALLCFDPPHNLSNLNVSSLEGCSALKSSCFIELWRPIWSPNNPASSRVRHLQRQWILDGFKTE